MVADGNLVDHAHPLNHAAENRVLLIETWLRLEADIELAAARGARRIDVVAGARGRKRAAQMLFRRADFGWNRIAGTAGAVAVRIAALHNEAGHYAMERQAVVKAVLGELFEVGHRFGRHARVKLNHNRTLVGVEHRVLSSIAHR